MADAKQKRQSRRFTFRLDQPETPKIRDARRELDRAVIGDALGRVGGDVAAAAALIGMTRRGLDRAIVRHGLEGLRAERG